jgi:hypothetical protein
MAEGFSRTISTDSAMPVIVDKIMSNSCFSRIKSKDPFLKGMFYPLPQQISFT